jgi:outer membrane protein assembly complex protein YaeT
VVGTSASSGASTASTTAAAPAPPVTAVNPRAADNQTVAQINLRADAPFDTAAVAQEVTLKTGQPVSIRELQSSIKNLFATGNFRDIRVDAAPSSAGVVLTFSLYLHYRVDEITIEGLARADRTRAQRELTTRPGDILSLDNVDDSAAAVESQLRQNGYLEATVDPETQFDRARNAATVTLHANPGPRAVVGDVVLEGQLEPFTRDELIKRMKRRPGRSFHVIEAREDAGRIKNFLVRRNYRRADVDFVGSQYDETTKMVTTRYRVQVGPIVKVDVTGIDRRSVRKWLPFAKNQEYSEDTIDQAADDIVEGLQQRGYYLATVDTESSLANNVWTTTFHVQPGAQYKLTSVTFSGNAKVGEKQLRKIVATSPGGGFKRLLQSIFRRPSGVTRGQLSDDRDALESFYRLEGFSEATVAEPVVAPHPDGTLTVSFPITEGPQTLVADVRTEGNETIVTDDLPKLQLVKGAPLNPQLLHDDVVALQTFYANKGHSEVQVAPRVEESADKTSATIAYVIAEGPRVHVDEVIVRGNTYTDREVILRKSDLEPGEPFSYTSMLEAQRELYRLGIFQRVEVQPQQTETTVSDRDVVIQVEEGRNLTLSGSVGLRAERGADPGSGTQLHERVAFAAAHRNLFGTGRYLGVEAVVSREEQEAFITYREPFIGRWNVPLQLQVFQSDDSTRPATNILQRGASIEVLKVARLQTRWSIRYEYKNSKCYKGDLCDEIEKGEPIEGVDRSLLNIQISSITPTFFWDTRDDIIDPHRGFFTSASVEYAFPMALTVGDTQVFDAKSGFWKEFVQGAYYLPIGGRTVLALSGRLGLIQPYAKSFDDVLGRDVLLPVPLSERFTGGGEISHRAFPLDRLGTLCNDPRDFSPDSTGSLVCRPTLVQPNPDKPGQIAPLGGNGLLVMNAEYRFPIFSSVGGALFADAGNVYADDEIDVHNIRYGAGFGVRYLSPVGPIRFDLAFPIQRRILFRETDGTPRYEDSFQYFITLGYAF